MLTRVACGHTSYRLKGCYPDEGAANTDMLSSSAPVALELASLTTENMPAPEWLLHGRPRVAIGHIIANKYRVICVKEASEKHQLLTVTGVNDEPRQTVYVVKVLNRAGLRDATIQSQLNTLYSAKGLNSRSHLICDFREGEQLHCLVFHRHTVTLATVLAMTDLMPLPDDHVEQMYLQVVSAVKALHQDHIVHTDICPDNIELVNAIVTTRKNYCADSGDFVERAVLSSVDVRLSYYGSAGLSHMAFGTDEYRAPELVFSGRPTYSSDCFSLGCVLGEIILGNSIFPRCESGPLYQQEKALLFHAISGPFCEEMAVLIESEYPRTFGDEAGTPIQYRGISDNIRRAIKTAIPVRYMFEDMDIAEVVEGLVCTNHDLRNSVNDVLLCKYFLP